jgi:hypothetical protein
MFFFARDELKKIHADGLGTYVGKPSNLANVVYQLLFLAQLCMGAAYPFVLQTVDFSDPQLSLLKLFNFMHTRKILYTINLALMWFKFMDHLQAFKSTAMFVLILLLMTEKLFEFLVVQMVSLCAFSTIDHFLFAFQRRSSRTLWASFSSKWTSAFWQEYEVRYRPGAEEDIMSTVLDMAFVVITIVLLMNFLITLLVDMYDQVKDEAAIRWCGIQASMLYDGEVTSRSIRTTRGMHITNGHMYKLKKGVGRAGVGLPAGLPGTASGSPATLTTKIIPVSPVMDIRRLRRSSNIASQGIGAQEVQLKKDVYDFCSIILKKPYDKQGETPCPPRPTPQLPPP